MLTADHLTRLLALIALRIPGFKMAPKSSSWFMRLVGWFAARVGVQFMTESWTTWGRTVYYPDGFDPQANPAFAFRVVAHEYVHLTRWQRSPFLFLARYGMPQILAIPFSLAAFGILVGFRGPWWEVLVLTFAAFVVVAAPWPSPWRRDEEIRGYVMEVLISSWLSGSPLDIPEDFLSGLVAVFAGWGYYRAEPSATRFRLEFLRVVGLAKTGALYDGADGLPYRDVRALLTLAVPGAASA